MAQPAHTRLTAAELARLPESSLPTELINGELIERNTPKDIHQKVAGQLVLLLAQAMPGGELRFSPSDVYLDDFNVVQPDLFWVSPDKSLCTLGEDGYWHGAPDLVIEIFSEGTVLRDRREKFLLYQKFGTREYWMVDPTGGYIEVWRLHGKELQRDGLFGVEDTFESAVLGGTKIEVAKVF